MDLAKWGNLGYLFWAYTLFWLLIAGYLVFISRRLGRVEKELDTARRAGRSKSS